MAGFLTDLVNNTVLDCYFGGAAITPPAFLYVGLSLTRAFRGGYVSEPTGGSYARVAVPNDLTHFPAARSGAKSNALPLVFPAPTSAWGSILSIFVADAPTDGHVLAMADLPVPKLIKGRDPAPTIALNSLYLTHA